MKGYGLSFRGRPLAMLGIGLATQTIQTQPPLITRFGRRIFGNKGISFERCYPQYPKSIHLSRRQRAFD